ncbi:hypothetical protein BJ742DRAFT_294415 [Cladochytrium replicatum]|nr:hypothetical protein BJ742DRAFT_294415 [Cladochytrium replicatum]
MTAVQSSRWSDDIRSSLEDAFDAIADGGDNFAAFAEAFPPVTSKSSDSTGVALLSDAAQQPDDDLADIEEFKFEPLNDDFSSFQSAGAAQQQPATKSTDNNKVSTEAKLAIDTKASAKQQQHPEKRSLWSSFNDDDESDDEEDELERNLTLTNSPRIAPSTPDDDDLTASGSQKGSTTGNTEKSSFWGRTLGRKVKTEQPRATEMKTMGGGSSQEVYDDDIDVMEYGVRTQTQNGTGLFRMLCGSVTGCFRG